MLSDYYVDLVKIDKVSIENELGGIEETFKEGAKFKGGVTRDTSITAKIAESDGFINVYTISTSKNVTLNYGDVIKRVNDGNYFKITSSGLDSGSPSISELDLRQYNAELYNLS